MVSDLFSNRMRPALRESAMDFQRCSHNSPAHSRAGEFLTALPDRHQGKSLQNPQTRSARRSVNLTASAFAAAPSKQQTVLSGVSVPLSEERWLISRLSHTIRPQSTILRPNSVIPPSQLSVTIQQSLNALPTEFYPAPTRTRHARYFSVIKATRSGCFVARSLVSPGSSVRLYSSHG